MVSYRKLIQIEHGISLQKCFRLQRKLAAIGIRKNRIGDLYNLTYWEPIVHVAMHIVRTRKGANTPGVDGVTKRSVNEPKLRDEIIRELKAGSLRPSALRKVEIPKPNGKVRTLSIPTYKDRIVLTILKLILEPIYEPHFDSSSYGFRPNMSTHDAIADIKRYIGAHSAYSWIIETDVKACFDSIPRTRLLAILEERIADGRLLQLINLYLKANMAMEGYPSKEDENNEAACGCPQGSPLSPLLCNIYLDKIDKFVNERIHRICAKLEKNRVLDPKSSCVRRRRSYQGHKEREARTGPFRLIRYADDLVILSPASKANVQAYWQEVVQFAWDKLRLRFAEEKTNIVHATEGFAFLGFHLKRIQRPDIDPFMILVNVDPKRKERHREAIRTLLKGRFDRETANVIQAMNQRIRGWRNYYQKSITNSAMLNYIDRLAFWSMLKWMCKKYKARKSKAMDIFYKRVKKGSHDCLTLCAHNQYLEKASWALPKHEFDYTRKPCHPWAERNPHNMIEAAFPNQSRAPDWDGSSGYGESYAKMTRKALERDKYCCIKCGKAEDLEVHHINKRNSFSNPKSRAANCLENLATLCRECHKFANRLSAIDCYNWLLSR